MTDLDNLIVVSAFCRNLGISRTAYYAWKKTGIPPHRRKEFVELINLHIKELSKIKADIEKDIPKKSLEWL